MTHVPVKLGILTITFERKSKRFIYQLGNATYSTYAAQLVYLLVFHPLELKDSHCEQHIVFYWEVSQPQQQVYFLPPWHLFPQNKVNWLIDPELEGAVGRRAMFLLPSQTTLPHDPHSADSYCLEGENADMWCDSPPLVPGYALVVLGALPGPANAWGSSAHVLQSSKTIQASIRVCSCTETGGCKRQ